MKNPQNLISNLPVAFIFFSTYIVYSTSTQIDDIQKIVDREILRTIIDDLIEESGCNEHND